VLNVIWIPGWHPTPLNELLGNHHKAGRLKAEDRKIVANAVRVHDAFLCGPTSKRKLSVHLILPKGQRAWDKDALWKSLADALVHAEMLGDDNPARCQFGEVTYSRAMDERAAGTMIVLEDLR
jgi:hypothetical protein